MSNSTYNSHVELSKKQEDSSKIVTTTVHHAPVSLSGQQKTSHHFIPSVLAPLHHDNPPSSSPDSSLNSEEQKIMTMVRKHHLERFSLVDFEMELVFEGRKVNLYAMLLEVRRLHGYKNVNAAKQWKQIFLISTGSSDSEVGNDTSDHAIAHFTRILYEKFLLKIENGVGHSEGSNGNGVAKNLVTVRALESKESVDSPHSRDIKASHTRLSDDALHSKAAASSILEASISNASKDNEKSATNAHLLPSNEDDAIVSSILLAMPMHHMAHQQKLLSPPLTAVKPSPTVKIESQMQKSPKSPQKHLNSFNSNIPSPKSNFLPPTPASTPSDNINVVPKKRGRGRPRKIKPTDSTDSYATASTDDAHSSPNQKPHTVTHPIKQSKKNAPSTPPQPIRRPIRTPIPCLPRKKRPRENADGSSNDELDIDFPPAYLDITEPFSLAALDDFIHEKHDVKGPPFETEEERVHWLFYCERTLKEIQSRYRELSARLNRLDRVIGTNKKRPAMDRNYSQPSVARHQPSTPRHRDKVPLTPERKSSGGFLVPSSPSVKTAPLSPSSPSPLRSKSLVIPLAPPSPLSTRVKRKRAAEASSGDHEKMTVQTRRTYSSGTTVETPQKPLRRSSDDETSNNDAHHHHHSPESQKSPTTPLDDKYRLRVKRRRSSSSVSS